jgi:outer membrane protein OmpA-like peptidoglycan-associated protein
MRTLLVSTLFSCIGLFSLASGDLLAESYLDSGASEAQIKRALLSTRTLSRQKAESRISTSTQRKRQITGASTSSAPSGHSGRASGSSGSGTIATATDNPPESAGDESGGPASFQIFFDLNSATLRTDAYPVLDRLASALGSPELQDYRFLVEGHTDATGSEAFNLELSQNRAQSVREYLVERHNIDPARLEPVGRGESDLYDPGHPASGKNRRVRFVNADEAY